MRIGIFGGTFNPIHNGHLNAIKYAKKNADLDKIYVTVAGDPYHKQAPCIDANKRLEWVRSAVASCFEGDDSVLVDDREIVRNKETYTIDTLLEYKTEFTTDKLVLIVGDDIVDQISSWKDSEQIRQLAELFVVPRKIMPISSSDIRVLASQKRSIHGLVPTKIEAEIIEKSLYNEEAKDN